MSNASTLSRLVLDLEKKTRAVERARELLAQLERVKTLPIEGERWALERLEQQSLHGRELLQRIADTKSNQECKPLIQRLESVLEEVDWELLTDVTPALQQKAKLQQGKLQEFNETFAEWRAYLDILRRDLLNARSKGVPFIEGERYQLRLDGLVTSLGRAIAEQNFLAVPGLVEEINKDDRRETYRSEEVQRRVEEQKSYALQADLLLLRPPANAALDVFEYTILLRTPSRPGSHGVNIQGTSTIVKADRDRLVELFGKITSAFDSSVRQSRSSVDAAPRAGQPGTLNADQLRDLYAKQSAGEVSGGNLNALLREVGDFMFRIFMPEQIVQFLMSQRCSLTLTTNDLELPWELMLTSDSAKTDRFICLDRPVARLPMGYVVPRLDFPEAPPRTKKHFLLIYSDPEKNLPTARREIETIKASLETKWKEDVEIDLICGDDATGDRLNEVLRANRFDVIHYAGHAAFDIDKPDLSALLLTKRERFFAQKIRRLLKGRPLVFLNACRSAATSNPEQAPQIRYELQEAEGLAAAFIYGGALGCLGAIWPVFDAPAAEFAVTFYDKVLEGEMIGEAVRQARLHILKKQQLGGITWASFTLYGDPTFRVFG